MSRSRSHTAQRSTTWPTGGIAAATGRPPHVTATIESRYDRTTEFVKRTRWGLVRVVWKKPSAYHVDGREAAEPMQYRTVVVNSPRTLPVILRVHFWPNWKDHDDVVGVQVNGGDVKQFQHASELLYEFGILRLHGGHSVVEWAER